MTTAEREELARLRHENYCSSPSFGAGTELVIGF